ncbi:MAG: chemotaxis protein CheD [Candidatus Hydrogenedentes bacterium]|nr:chemotaxis protein CheD [Candidatus Hydrogenedentota bacterium]
MNLTDGNQYYLDPGYIYFSQRAAAVRTVVGSGVAVCLWDRALKYGGVSHFVAPIILEPSKATPRYGNVATAALVQIMDDSGCRRNDVVAQIVGGGFPENEPPPHIGDDNARVAREVLSRKGIAILSEDIGGHLGRKILFDIGTGQLAVLKVHKIRDTDWHRL